MLGESTERPLLCSSASLSTHLWHRIAGHQDKNGLRSTWWIQAHAIVKGDSLSVKEVAFFLAEDVLWYLIFPSSRS